MHRLRDKVVAAPRQQEVAACSAAAVCWRPGSCWGRAAAAAAAAHARFRGALEGCAAGHLLQRPVLGPLLPPVLHEASACSVTRSCVCPQDENIPKAAKPTAQPAERTIANGICTVPAVQVQVWHTGV